jgi:hypothetical protein
MQHCGNVHSVPTANVIFTSVNYSPKLFMEGAIASFGLRVWLLLAPSCPSYNLAGKAKVIPILWSTAFHLHTFLP